MLLEAPGGDQVPPLRAVVEVVEPNAAQGRRFLGRAPERLRHEEGARLPGLGARRQPAPQRGGHLVGRVAPEPGDAEVERPIDEALPEAPERLTIGAAGIVHLGQVAPDDHLAGVGGIHGKGAHESPVARPPEPGRVPSHQGTVLRRVVHDQVDHDTEAHRPDRPDRVGERIDAPFPGARLEGRVEPVVFLDGVEAPREPRVTERVDVDPVEPHGAGTLGVRDPSVHGSHERREQVVDDRPHERSTLATRCQGRARRVLAFLHYEGSLPDWRVPTHI